MLQPLVQIRIVPRHGTTLHCTVGAEAGVNMFWQWALIEMVSFGEGHQQSNIGPSKDSQQHQSNVITLESMSTSFLSWLDPSTLMLPPLPTPANLNLASPPSSSHCLPSPSLTASFYWWLEQGTHWAASHQLHLSATPAAAAVGKRGRLECRREGAGFGSGARDDDFSEQLPRPRQAFLDSLPEPLRLFRRLRGSGAPTVGRWQVGGTGVAWSRCTHWHATHWHPGKESPMQDNLGHCHKP